MKYRHFLLMLFMLSMILISLSGSAYASNKQFVSTENTVQTTSDDEKDDANMLEKILTNPFVVLLGWVIGLISGILQITSHFKDRKTQGYLFEKAKQELKGTYTKEQIEELSKILHNLERQISNDLPRLAKKIIREKQRSEIAVQISNYYSEYKKLENFDDANDIVLDDNIKEAIEGELIGNLSVSNKNKNTLQYILAGISFLVVASILSFIFPYIERSFDYRLRVDNILYNIFKHFIPYQAIPYLLALLAITFLIRKTNVKIFKNNRLLNTRITKYILNFLWFVMLVEVYFEPIALGTLWCTVGAVITLIPFTLAQIVTKRIRSKLTIKS